VTRPASVRRIARRAAVAALLLFVLAPLLSACGGDGRTPLVVYSPHGRELLSHFEERYEASRPGVDVQWVDMGSQEVLDRVRSERANPQADVWWGAPSGMFDRAADAGLLAAFRPSWWDAVPSTARDSAGRWVGTYRTPEVIAYNSDSLSASDAPRTWDDLLAPRWRGEVLVRDPLASGTMRAIFGAIMWREFQETGDPEAGYEWLLELDAQTSEYVLNPTLLYQKLARQEGLVAPWNMPDIETLDRGGGRGRPARGGPGVRGVGRKPGADPGGGPGVLPHSRPDRPAVRLPPGLATRGHAPDPGHGDRPRLRAGPHPGVAPTLGPADPRPGPG